MHEICKKMPSAILLMFHYDVFFHSVTNYGIITWSGAYTNCLSLPRNQQKRILKIIINNKVAQGILLNIEDLFAPKSVRYHYDNFKSELGEFSRPGSITRNRSAQLPIRFRTIRSKISFVRAISVFISFSNLLIFLNIGFFRKNKL